MVEGGSGLRAGPLPNREGTSVADRIDDKGVYHIELHFEVKATGHRREDGLTAAQVVAEQQKDSNGS